MKKYECRCNKGKEHHCTHESDGRKPTICCVAGDGSCDWQEVENPESLPKLTVEALKERGIEWPEWSKSAVVDPNGIGYFCVYVNPDPRVNCWAYKDFFTDPNSGEFFEAIPGKWDASDWTNSLIARPIIIKSDLPEWCKAGALIHNKAWGFARIVAICGNHQSVEVHWMSGGTGCPAIANCKPAHVRPWTFEEAPGFIKVRAIESGKELALHLVYSKSMQSHAYWFGYPEIITIEGIAEHYLQLDGSPCGVLEMVE